MKSLFFAFIIMPFFHFTDLDQNIASINKAISEGNVEALSVYFDKTVEVAVLTDENIYDKAKAKTIVQGFFAKNKPSAYKTVHQGASKGNDSQYCIGSLTTNTGNYRVYLYLKNAANQFLIQEIRFEKDTAKK